MLSTNCVGGGIIEQELSLVITARLEDLAGQVSGSSGLGENPQAGHRLLRHSVENEANGGGLLTA